MKKHSQLLALILLISLFTLNSCNKRVSLKKLNDNRELWESVNTGNYDFNHTNSCFCPWTGESRVIVRGDTIQDVQDLVTGGTLYDPYDSTQVVFEEWPNLFKTIDELFDLIQKGRDDKWDALEVEFDKELGYPSLISADPWKDAYDEEQYFEASKVEFK